MDNDWKVEEQKAAERAVFLSELAMIKGLMGGVTSSLGLLNSTTYPVAANMVVIPGMPAAANAIRLQNNCIEKLIQVIEKLVPKAI